MIMSSAFGTVTSVISLAATTFATSVAIVAPVTAAVTLSMVGGVTSAVGATVVVKVTVTPPRREADDTTEQPGLKSTGPPEMLVRPRALP